MSLTNDTEKTSKPIEVLDWNSLIQYTQFLSQGDESKVKICLVDEEQEEICLQTSEDFNCNIQCARNQGLSSVKLMIYKENQHLFEGIYHIENESSNFPTDKLEILFEKGLVEKWYIPVKQDEALGLCLKSSILLAEQNQFESNVHCQRFVQNILPEVFEKLLNSTSVYSWPQEIQHGIFDLVELLIDLIGIRIRSAPIPIVLLKVLALVFDTTTSFSKQHQVKALPKRRTYTLSDEQFLLNDANVNRFGWLRSILQRFVAQDGVKNVQLQFKYVDKSNPNKAATEYNALLKIFSRCHLCINAERFRLIFIQPIYEAMEFVQRQPASDEINQLIETLKDISRKYQIHDELDQTLSTMFNPKISERLSIETPSNAQRKSKSYDSCETLTNELISLKMTNNDSERKNIKKQRTDEQAPTPLFTGHNVIDENVTLNDKNSLKRKQRRSTLTSLHNNSNPKKDLKRSNSILTSYDRTNPADILRYFAAMKVKVARLYDDLQVAISFGKVREVLKIEEKLKLLRPYSARFVVDENIPDGTIMQTGETFRKGWIIFNDGSLPWDDETIQLINLSDGIQVVGKAVIPVTAPHDKALITVDYTCPHQPGTYESKWILAYRQQTFGPMIWCSIEVRRPEEFFLPNEQTTKQTLSNSLDETFEFVDVPLPDCFDLSKPFRGKKMETFDRNSVFMKWTESSSDRLINEQLSNKSSLSTVSTTNETNEDSKPLIELVTENENCQLSSIQSNSSTDFIDRVVNNLFNVTNQARSTAKNIFNSLHSVEESSTPIGHQLEERSDLINSYQSETSEANVSFDSIPESKPSNSSIDPMRKLVEMGFANRAKNQRLLNENNNDLEKTVELLTIDGTEDPEWFNHRH